MKLDFTLPAAYEVELRGRLMGAEIEYCIPYDLSRSGTYTEGYLVITKHSIFLLENRQFKEQIDLKDNMKFTVQELNASGSLEMEFNEQHRHILSFTLDHMARHASIAQHLTNSCMGLFSHLISSGDGESTCPKCGKKYLRKTTFCVDCDKKSGVLKRLIGLAKPFWVYYLGVIAVFWVGAGIMLYQPYLSRKLITDIVDPATRKEPDLKLLLFYVGLMAVLGIVSTGANVLRGLLMNITSSKLTFSLRDKVHRKIQSLSVKLLETRKTGELMHRVTRDTERIQNFIDNMASGINELFLLLAVSILLLSYNWKMALIVMLPTPLILFLFRFWHKMWRRYRAQWSQFDRLNTFLNDILRGIRVVKAFGQEDQAIERFKKDASKLRDTTAANEMVFYSLMPFTNFIFGIAGMLLILYCGNEVIGAQMTKGELVQLSIYSSYFYQRIEFIVAFPRWMNEAVVNAQRVFEVLDAEIPVDEGELISDKSIKGEFQFDNVTFGYLSYKNVLRDIKLNVKEGEMIGLVGSSGAGKSTLINLIMRMYEPQQGSIIVDGDDIKEITRKCYQSQIGVVLQETFLFSGSILDNIRYANPNATLDEVIQAAKVSNAHDFIINFPAGYDTRVGENGAKLSGGERQRIAIARAILVNPRILILDEATASVDTETEKQIQDALKRVVKNRTTFAIAHRLSTLKNADRIIVLEEGKIIEAGGHKELLDLKGKYYNLVQAQMQLTAIKAIE